MKNFIGTILFLPIPFLVVYLMKESLDILCSNKKNVFQIEKSFEFAIKILGILTVLITVQYFQEEARLKIKSRKPIAIDNVSDFLNEEKINKDLQTCISPHISYSSLVPGTSVFAAHYLNDTSIEGNSEPDTFLDIPRLVIGTESDLKEFGEEIKKKGGSLSSSNMKVTDFLLERAKYLSGVQSNLSGFESQKMESKYILGEKHFLTNMIAFTAVMKTYGIPLVPKDPMPDLRGFPRDLLADCISSLPKEEQINAFQRLADARVFWQPIEIRNISNLDATNITIYFKGPWTKEIVEDSVKISGGQVLFKADGNNRFTVHYPYIAKNKSKLIFLKSWNRPLGHKFMDYDLATAKQPSMPLFFKGFVLLIFATLAHLVFHRKEE